MVDDDLNFTLFFVHDNFLGRILQSWPPYYSIRAFWFKYLVLIINGLIIALQFSGRKKKKKKKKKINAVHGSRTSLIKS